jgi:hypothetical protein
MVVLDIRLVGCEQDGADVAAVRREFASVEALRATGRGSAGPAQGSKSRRSSTSWA